VGGLQRGWQSFLYKPYKTKKAIKQLLSLLVLAMCWGMVISSLISLFLNTHYTGKLISETVETDKRKSA